MTGADPSRITVIIPALNEAGNIAGLVVDVCAALPCEVIVVDNGSTDTTATEAAQAGAGGWWWSRGAATVQRAQRG